MRSGLDAWTPLLQSAADESAEAQAAFDEITFVLGVALHLTAIVKAARQPSS